MQRVGLPLVTLLALAASPAVTAQTTAGPATEMVVAGDAGTVLWQFDTGG